MDKSSVSGIVLALGGVVAGLLLEGGNLRQVLQPTAAMIVFGGTIGAVMLQFPLSVLIQAVRRLASVFSTPTNFTPVEGDLEVQPSVRANVKLSRLNLSDDAKMSLMKSMDIVFCCNVLIYFDVASKRNVLEHFYNSLLPHGYLFLSHSESLYGVSTGFRLVHLPGATAYVKGERSPAGKQEP